MRRWLFSLFMLLLSLSLFTVVAFADTSGTCGPDLTWGLDAQGTLTISGSGAMTNYSYNGAPWYSNCSSIISVVFQGDVTSIGNSAFLGCRAMTSVTIPSSVTNIGSFAFMGCGSLTSLTIPDKVTNIGFYAFQACSGLTSVTIPSGVTSIGTGAFSECHSLTSLTVATGNTRYVAVDNVLYNSSRTELLCYPAGKTGDFTIPTGVTSIGGGAFLGCSGLTSVKIPAGVTSINANAFLACSSLTSVTIPETVTSIGSYTFPVCRNLKDVYYTGTSEQWSKINIGDGNDCLTAAELHYGEDAPADEIASGTCGEALTWSLDAQGTLTISGSGAMTNYAYADLQNIWAGNAARIKNVVITNGVTSISDLAFYGCSNLTSVTIPSSVTSIGDAIFEGCGNMTQLTVASGNTSYVAVDNVLYNSNMTVLMYYPAGSKTDVFTVPEGVTQIGIEAFYSCSNLRGVNLPESLTSIEGYAFAYSGLTSVTIPVDVSSIERTAFLSCKKLTQLTVAEGNNSFAAVDNVLYDSSKTVLLICPSGKTGDFTIPSGVTSINGNAFWCCDSLTGVTIPQGVTSIDSAAFRECFRLTSVTIPDSVKNIGKYAFAFCFDLSNVTIPSGVTSIASMTFYSCTNLTSVEIPSSVTYIDDTAFSGCSSLKDIYLTGKAQSWEILNAAGLPENVTIHCSSFEYGMILPAARIEEEAFLGNTSIRTVYIPDGCSSIGENAFSGCSNLALIRIPDGIAADLSYLKGTSVILCGGETASGLAQSLGLKFVSED